MFDSVSNFTSITTSLNIYVRISEFDYISWPPLLHYFTLPSTFTSIMARDSSLTFVSALFPLQSTLNPVISVILLNRRSHLILPSVLTSKTPLGYGFSWLVWLHLLLVFPLFALASTMLGTLPSEGLCDSLWLFSVIHIPDTSLPHLF